MSRARDIGMRMASAIDHSFVYTEPFEHVILRQIFDPLLYFELCAAALNPLGYEPLAHPDYGTAEMSRRHRRPISPDTDAGTLLDDVRAALSSDRVCGAFFSRLSIPKQPVEPRVVIYRDVPGFEIKPHTDKGKVLTCQIALTASEKDEGHGTDYFRRDSTEFVRELRMPFAANCGHAFKVGDESWHGAGYRTDGTAGGFRYSLMLIYYTPEAAAKVGL